MREVRRMKWVRCGLPVIQDVPSAQICDDAEVALRIKKIYSLFMVPNAFRKRLSISMQSPGIYSETWPQPQNTAAFGVSHKESTLKLSFKTRNCGDVIIIHCQGRIVYRDEASALSELVAEILQNRGKVVLDLSGVSSIDSAGIGELVWLHTRAQSQNADMKYAGPSPLVRELLGLTNVDSFLDIHPSLCHALASFPAEACADC
jgi:anti-sigma B factor antagonist